MIRYLFLQKQYFSANMTFSLGNINHIAVTGKNYTQGAIT